MQPPPLLAWFEPSLPAPTPIERARLARRHDLALELSDDGRLEADPYVREGVVIASLQARRLREDPPAHRDRARRQEAARHLAAAMEAAARLGAARVLAVAAWGEDLSDRPAERALDFFAAFEGRARDWGVRLLLEPASAGAAAALTDAEELARLVATLAAPDAFGLALDTATLAAGGAEPDGFLRSWRHPLDELRVSGVEGAPPDPETPLGEWLAALPAPPGALVVEHRAPIAIEAFAELVAALRAALTSRSGWGG